MDTLNAHNLTLDCAFVHRDIVLQVLSEPENIWLQQKLGRITFDHSSGIWATMENVVFTDAVLHILRSKRAQSLELLLVNEKPLQTGMLVWIEQTFLFRGTGKAWLKHQQTRRSEYASFSAALPAFNGIMVKGRFNAAHLFGSSSVSRLTGKTNVFVLAYIKAIAQDSIELRSIFIGDRMVSAGNSLVVGLDYLCISMEEIDEFNKGFGVPHTAVHVNMLKDIPEAKVKQWFADLLGETNVPKDWGGENSDLFTNHIHINGKRLKAAFLLKGPAKFKPMNLADLGKAGNQIERLYNEPADVYILQHCHHVKPEVYKTMRAFSAQFDKLSRYCIIDGPDTARILKAYKKL